MNDFQDFLPNIVQNVTFSLLQDRLRLVEAILNDSRIS